MVEHRKTHRMFSVHLEGIHKLSSEERELFEVIFDIWMGNSGADRLESHFPDHLNKCSGDSYFLALNYHF